MKDKRTIICDENSRDLLRLVVRAFTPAEKKALTNARKKLGVDRPLFYHNAIIKYVEDINGGQDA